MNILCFFRFKKTSEYDKLRLNGLHKDHPLAKAISKPANAAVNKIYKLFFYLEMLLPSEIQTLKVGVLEV